MSRSFFQSVCVLGYCLFPLTIAAFINVFVHTPFVRLPVIVITYAWSSLGLLLLRVTNDSFGVCLTWKSTPGKKMVGYLSFVIILFRLGIHYPHFELEFNYPLFTSYIHYLNSIYPF
jgi:hypothetical protein